MSSNTVVPLVIAVVFYALFGTFNAQAGGRIDAALCSAIFNGLAAALALAVVVWQHYLSTSPPVATRVSGVVYSILAGAAVGVFSILLIGIYGRGGELSSVFPIIYGGAIALTAIIGWLVLKDTLTPLHVAGVAAIVAGIVLVTTK